MHDFPKYSEAMDAARIEYLNKLRNLSIEHLGRVSFAWMARRAGMSDMNMKRLLWMYLGPDVKKVS